MLKHSYCNNAQKTILRKKLIRGTEEVRDDSNSWLWIKKDIRRKNPKGLAPQNQSLQTRWVKQYIYRN